MNTNNTPIALDRLPVGQKAAVATLVSEGAARRRLLDLGLIVGTEVEPLYKSPAGNPAAYMIRGTVIALRSDVAEKVLVCAP